MKKLLVYPFSVQTVPLARYSDMLLDYDVVIPVTEDGSVLKNRDVSYLDGGSPAGVNVSISFREAVVESDAVLFCNEIYNEQNTRNNFLLAKKQGKSIIAVQSFFDALKINSENCLVLTNSKCEDEITSENVLRDINVPVILIMGQGKQCHKFDIQLALRKKFINLGYKVSQVGTKEYSALFGFHSIPFFPDDPFWKKILLYNCFFRSIVDSEKPDVLIVGAPGGIMPIDSRHNELFGETSITISTSIQPDISIFSMYLAKSNNETLNTYKNYSRYAMSTPLDYFHVSNTKLVFETDMRTINYLTTDSQSLPNWYEGIDEELFNIFNHESFDNVFDDIVSRLQNNIAVI